MRLRTVIVAAVGVLAMSTTATPIASAQEQEASDRLEAIPAGEVPRDLVLNDHHGEWQSRVDALTKKLPNAHVRDIVGDVNHSARPVCKYPGYLDGHGFCWNEEDHQGATWVPQGLTASWDADWDGKDGGTYDGHKIILTSWYDKGKKDGVDRGVRITFVNYDNPSKPEYRHAILVVPTKKGDIAPVIDHAGGIAWVGKKLYVADTWGGLRLFDLGTIWRGAKDDTHKRFRVKGDKIYAADYRYVIPQVGYYSTPGDAEPNGCSPDVLRTSFASVDSKTRTLATGEFCAKGKGGRIARWKVDDNGLLESKGGKVTAADGYRVPHARMQGAVSYDRRFASTSSENGGNGDWHAMSLNTETKTESLNLPGPEDMTYDPWTDRVWTLTEHAGERAVFAIPDASLKP